MILAIATAALVFISPPAKYDKGVPPGYTVHTETLGVISEACRQVFGEPTMPGAVILGCTIAPLHLILLPLEDDKWPYEHACWLMNARHEAAHAWGWKANHPGGHTYVCYPK